MTLEELYTMLKATGYPVAYSHFNGTPSIPFITYLTPGTENFHADNKVYTKINNADIELYTNKKDLQAESKLENLLDQNNIPWDVTETWIDSEKLFQRIYEVRLI